MKKALIIFLTVLGLGVTISTTVAQAGSVTYDPNTGYTIIKVTDSAQSGKDLNSFAGRFPGSVANKMRKAAISKYGSVSDGKTYYFSYTNKVGGKGGTLGGVYTSAQKGIVVDMRCTGRR
ncbi:hypothetical protein AB6876_00940 [Carnobacterium maltaromaticum]|uniref:hypothetical protein n=1 Tax=Carnobacterium maltaromaticum TaxID=2751 RepID=UPI0039BE5675